MEPGEFVKANFIIRAMLARPWLCAVAGHGALIIETIVMPLALLMPSIRPVALLAGVGLHTAILVLHGYAFVFNPPCYFLALWWPHAELLNIPTAMAGLLAAWSTVRSLEVSDWMDAWSNTVDAHAGDLDWCVET